MERQYKDSGIEWIGRIPEGWKTQRGKTLGDISHGVSFTPSDLRDKDEGVLILRASNVQNSQLDFQDNVYIPKSKIPIEKLLKKDDIVICGTNGSLALVGKSALVKENIEASYGYFMLRLRTKEEPRFIHYQLTQIVDMYRGLFATTTINQLTISQLQNILFVIPPLPEQQRIASFLDKKCGEIDELIALQEKMIAQLTEYKQAVITEAVTKGLDPNAKLVPSGIEWIGDVPEGWSINKINRLFRMIGSGTTPSSSDDDAYIGTINWLQSGDINGGIIANANKRISIDTLDKYPALSVYKQPFIIVAMYGASVGNISISHIDACVNQACCVMSESIINFNYAFYAIKSAQRYLIYRAVGGGQPNISQNTLRQLWLPVPPLPDQQRIASYLDTKCSEIDSLITLKRQKIESLKAYKKSVIYEAVTGKTIIE